MPSSIALVSAIHSVCAGSLLLRGLLSSFGELGLFSVRVWGLLTAVASLVREHRPQGVQAQELRLRGVWGLPRVGIEPESPVLAVRFFTPEPPGSPSLSF